MDESRNSNAGDLRSMNILMYHSISNRAGPTSIPPETFRGQMEALAELGYGTIGPEQVHAWMTGEGDLPVRSVFITFDDGFADFAERVFPILQPLGYTATVYLPSGRIGGSEDWQGADTPPRRLMSWAQVAGLAREGVTFGGHSVTHADLTRLPPGELEREVRQCRDDIGERLGRPPMSFAPPYGRAGKRELREIRRSFGISVGTKLRRASKQSDRFKLPRIEMHYFRDPGRWKDYLSGRAEWYFQARRALRGVREFVAGA